MPDFELNEENLHERCRFWQKALRLYDWNLAAAILPVGDLPENSQAHIEHQPALRSALLGLCRPEDYPRTEPFVRDWEQSVVHELLHLHTDVFGTEAGSVEGTAEEQAVDAIAKALVKLRRGEAEDPAPDVAEDLEGAVAWWQRVLSLRDWRIRAEFVPRRHWHEGGGDVTGYCNPDIAQQNAVLHLRHPDESQPGTSFPEEHDAEIAMLHEIVHIHLHPIWDGEAEGLKHDMQERAVELIAQALVDAARDGTGASAP